MTRFVFGPRPASLAPNRWLKGASPSCFVLLGRGRHLSHLISLRDSTVMRERVQQPRLRYTSALSLRTGQEGVTKLLAERRMNKKQCARHSQNPMDPRMNAPLTDELTATIHCHAGVRGSSSAASTACATMCESLPAIRTSHAHSQSHPIAVVALLTVKHRVLLSLRRLPKRRTRNAPPNRPPQSTSRKKTWRASIRPWTSWRTLTGRPWRVSWSPVISADAASRATAARC